MESLGFVSYIRARPRAEKRIDYSSNPESL
jgi:hypothetical protein